MKTLEEEVKKMIDDAKSEIINSLCPVGKIIYTDNNTNPGTYITGTTWELYGVGRMLVCVDTSNSNFSTAGKTGGSDTVSHTHTYRIKTSISHSVTSNVIAMNNSGGNGTTISTSTGNALNTNNALDSGSAWNYNDGTNTVTQGTTYSTSTSNLSSYITGYRWRRIA